MCVFSCSYIKILNYDNCKLSFRSHKLGYNFDSHIKRQSRVGTLGITLVAAQYFLTSKDFLTVEGPQAPSNPHMVAAVYVRTKSSNL